MLVQSSDGAIFASVVEAVVGPLASLFWTLYRYNKSDNSIHWHPVFNETTAFSLAGLGLMIPGIILYHYFVIQEEKSEEVNLENLVNTNSNWGIERLPYYKCLSLIYFSDSAIVHTSFKLNQLWFKYILKYRSITYF